MRGRKPKPLNIQIAEGDPRKKGVRKLQEATQGELKAQHGLPVCPDYLDELEREQWRKWSEELEAMDCDYRIDAAKLEAACIAYGEVRRAIKPVERRQALKVFQSLTSDFPFSPASRSRIHIERRETTKNELKELLDQPYEKAKIAVQ